MPRDDADRLEVSSQETTAQPKPAPRVDAARFTPGTVLASRYRIVSPLGKGGMGEVYRADDIRLGQPVALKFLPAALAAEPGRLERLVDEVRIGRQVSHPNVCRLYDIAEAEGQHFLVMEYVDGEDLASLLRRIGRLPADKALELARGLCAGLAAAHDKNVIHRDLKPANVMVDGRGHARIADFGLAALAGSGPAAELAGTAVYMAPEQLRGGAASLRSDVFALGLVLHEMLTGRRVFDASSLAELKALHADTKPLRLSGSAKDVDPGFERVVLRCLARDPNERPASAAAVLAALPGGDPLQAAVLAGQTPSPEMVAAAGKVGDLRPALAWLALACGLAGLLAAAAVMERVALFHRVPLAKSPDALTGRAKDVLARLGYEDPPRDTARGFLADFQYLEYVEQQDRTPTRWERLPRARPGPLLFYHRQSPGPLVASGWIPTYPWAGPPELGRVTRNTPPLDLPGMAEVVVDATGRLVRFATVPARFEPAPGPWPEPEWPLLLAEAGFDPGSVRPAPSRWAAPVDTDRKAAWEASYRDQPGVSMQVEAAAYHGRPVYFEVYGPWRRPPAAVEADPPALAAAKALVFLVSAPLLGAGIVLVRRNIRLGRSDRRGAFRLALFTFGALALAHFFRADHTSLANDEYALVVAIVSQGCYGALFVWSIYMALEPPLRRRWPHMLISWSRLLEGRFRDPLVARDVLLGMLLGLGVILGLLLGAEAPAWFGQAPSIANLTVTTLSSPRHLAYFFLMGPCLGIVYAVSLAFILYLAHTLVRRLWAARLLVFLFVFVPGFAGMDHPIAGAVVASIFAGLLLLALTRFGLLSTAALASTFIVLLRTPLTLDWSDWYAGRSFAALGVFAAVLLFTAHASLGGKPPFGRALLED